MTETTVGGGYLGVELTWLGHAGIALRGQTCSLLVDPWMEGNPHGAELPEDFVPSGIFVTHGHADHFGDSMELARRFSVPIVASPEVAAFAARNGVTSELINYGGTYVLEGAEVKCVLAFHSSSIGPDRLYGGNPCGFVIKMDSVTIYHAGDTCLFGDMRLIGETYPLDVAILPIGGRTTMDPDEALKAIQWLKPRRVLPIHFNTWPFIEQDPVAFATRVHTETDAEILSMDPGGVTELKET